MCMLFPVLNIWINSHNDPIFNFIGDMFQWIEQIFMLNESMDECILIMSTKVALNIDVYDPHVLA